MKGRREVRVRVSSLMVRIERSTSPTCASAAAMLRKTGRMSSRTQANSMSAFICVTVMPRAR